MTAPYRPPPQPQRQMSPQLEEVLLRLGLMPKRADETGAAKQLADFIPGVGDVRSAQQGVRDLEAGAFGSGVLGLLAALPVVPGMLGNVLKKRKLRSGAKGAPDVAEALHAERVIPNRAPILQNIPTDETVLRAGYGRPFPDVSTSQLHKSILGKFASRGMEIPSTPEYASKVRELLQRFAEGQTGR